MRVQLVRHPVGDQDDAHAIARQVRLDPCPERVRVRTPAEGLGEELGLVPVVVGRRGQLAQPSVPPGRQLQRDAVEQAQKHVAVGPGVAGRLHPDEERDRLAVDVHALQRVGRRCR